GVRGAFDAPEGIGRQAPQAPTTMTKGQSGANAPDRNRRPTHPSPPTRRASKELRPTPATSHQQPATSNQQPATSNQQPITIKPPEP
ncbi:hypothetical protein ABE485_27810, partial [Achromobacter spanius]|uniref:hypothetical protein n=1 Tax=Achromobacter spanius TaxID=217203 RepID=UPI00320BF13D